MPDEQDHHGGQHGGDGAQGEPDVRALAVTSSALACLESAQELWAEHPGAKLGALVDEAMASVSPER